MTKVELKLLRKKLPREAIKNLAKEFEVTEAHIRLILNGERNNLNVINVAIIMAEEHQEYLKNLSNKIKKL
jgi:hypothetical protein